MRSFTGGRWVCGLLAGCALVLSLAGFVRLAPGVTSWDPLDFSVYYACAALLNHGQFDSLYDVRAQDAMKARMGLDENTVPYNYPPFMAVVMRPMARLSFRSAVLLWLSLNLVLLASAARVLLRLARLPTGWWASVMAFLVCLIFHPVIWTLVLGQINIVLLFLIAWAIWLIEPGQGGRRREALGGALIGLAASIKIYPGLLVIPLLLHRRWRAVAGAFVAALTTVLVGILGAGGPRNTIDYVVSVAPHAESPMMYQNQSLFAWVRRLLEDQDYRFAVFDPNHVVSFHIPALVNAPVLVRPVTGLLAAGVLLVTYRCLTRLRRSDRSLRVDAALVLAASLLVFPLVWDHWHTILLLAWAALVSYRRPTSKAVLLPLVGALLVAFHRYWRTLVYFGWPVGKMSFALFAAFVTWVALVVLERGPTEDSVPAEALGPEGGRLI